MFDHKKQYEFFLPLGTEDTFYEMQLPGHYGIGVVTGERPDYLAIGLLTFHVVERDRLDESYAVIDRICVAEDYRIRNFGRSLMNELLYNLREMKVESVFMDLPESGLPDLEKYFESCKFKKEVMGGSTYRITLEEAKELLGPPLQMYPDNHALEDVEFLKVKRSLKNCFREVYVKGEREILLMPWEKLEHQISIVHEGKSGFDAFALFLAAPSGRLILDYFGGADEVSCEVMRMVMSDAISMALLKYKGKTMLEIPVKSEQEDEVLHILFPRIKRIRVNRFARYVNDKKLLRV